MPIHYLPPVKYVTYILYSRGHDTFYIGQTKDMDVRLSRHNAGAVKSTARYAPWSLCLRLEKESRSEATVLEKKLKNLNRVRLVAFIGKYGGAIPGAE